MLSLHGWHNNKEHPTEMFLLSPLKENWEPITFSWNRENLTWIWWKSIIKWYCNSIGFLQNNRERERKPPNVGQKSPKRNGNSQNKNKPPNAIEIYARKQNVHLFVCRYMHIYPSTRPSSWLLVNKTPLSSTPHQPLQYAFNLMFNIEIKKKMRIKKRKLSFLLFIYLFYLHFSLYFKI